MSADGVPVTLCCAWCGAELVRPLPDPVDAATLAALIAELHTAESCPEWDTAEIEWPDGTGLLVELVGVR